MTTYIQTDHFTNPLCALLDETFDSVHGAYLDKGTSLFETLATISAAEASAPVGGRCATLAAQVKHVAFYLDVLEQVVRTQQFERQDWGKIWRETSAVTPEEWQALKSSLRQSYDRIRALISYHSAALGVFPGGDPWEPASERLAGELADATGYPYPPIDIGCHYTGTLADWAVENGVQAAVDMELSNHQDAEFQKNLRAVEALLGFRE